MVLYMLRRPSLNKVHKTNLQWKIRSVHSVFCLRLCSEYSMRSGIVCLHQKLQKIVNYDPYWPIVLKTHTLCLKQNELY
jgi:hypothetical protein